MCTCFLEINALRQFFYQSKCSISIFFFQVPEDRKFTICGDIHGQFYDLLNIFKLNGKPSEENPYLFNGDFVDRGSFSVECIFVLLSYKLLYPNHFFMSRGNHESENMNKMYGFEGEVKAKYSANMVDLFTEVYNWLPLCHCINQRVLVMHGGLFAKVSQVTRVFNQNTNGLWERRMSRSSYFRSTISTYRKCEKEYILRQNVRYDSEQL